MRGIFDKKFRNTLVQAGVVTAEVADKALEEAANEKEMTYAEYLLEKAGIKEDKYLDAISREARVPPVDISKITPMEEATAMLSKELSRYYCVLPLAQCGKILTLAVANPFDLLRLDELSSMTGCEIRQVVAAEGALKRMIQKVYNPVEKQILEQLESKGATDENLEVKVQKSESEEDAEFLSALNLTDLANDNSNSPIVKLVNLMLTQALREHATDIHIEPFENVIDVRYRIDGRLRTFLNPPKSMHPELITRIKVMAGCDVAERRIPQDGKIQVLHEGRQIDVRTSILPTINGEKVVLRLLDSGTLASLNLSNLGFEKSAEMAFRKAIDAPYGMVLVTGPTGSGKSTTLYASLREIMDIEENIVTVEDPVEYQIDGINQVMVNVKRGLTFANALRAILRQDPDVLLVGEIRDHETADIAIKAALTGHLVLSTLHTNDAPSTITRLLDMGIDRFLIASAINLVSAQRLLRRLCPECKVPMEKLPPEKYLLKLGFREEELRDVTLFEPKGCQSCFGNGYRGRFAILEAMEVDEEVRRLIIAGESHLKVREYSLRKGMITLRRCAILNAIRGRTSLQEVLNMTMGDEAE